jgi:hypothetical protein
MFKRYLVTYFIAAAVATALAITANFAIDPYGVYKYLAVDGLNARKPAMADHARTAKPYQVTSIKPATILLGNSRTEAGLDPASTVWPQTSKPVFNLSVSGSGLPLQLRFLQHAISTQMPQTVVVGLDFTDFLRPAGHECSPSLWPSPSYPFESSLRVTRAGQARDDHWQQRVIDARDTLLSVEATWDSIVTLFGQSDTSPTRTEYGFNPNDDVAASISVEGYMAIFNHADSLLFRQLNSAGPNAFVPSPECSRPFSVLEAIFEAQRKEGFTLHLYIHPYHARFFTLIQEMNLWNEYANWKRFLIRVTAEASDAHGKDIPLWDFSYHNRLTTEMPTAGMHAASDLRYFWESGHYKAAVGDVIVATILGQRASEYGTRMSLETVDTHLARTRELRDSFNSTHPGLAAEIRKRFAPSSN